MEVRGKSLGRNLTPEEAAQYRRLAELADAEIPEVRRRIQADGYYGHATTEDAREVIRLGAFLRVEREHLGLDLAEVSKRSGVKAETLLALEEGRLNDDYISLLSRYARAVGLTLMLGLRPAGAAAPPATAQPLVEAHA